MQMNASYLVTDPKGTLIVECGKMLATHGYKIRVLNTIRFRESMHDNPFAYVHTEADVMRSSLCSWKTRERTARRAATSSGFKRRSCSTWR